MITEDYVSFEIANLLKEKGFDENTPVNYFIGDDKPRGCVLGEMIYHKRLEEDTHLIACPTLQMAMKWLREVHKWHIEILRGEYGYFVHIVSAKNLSTENYTVQLEGGYNLSYEEAAEAAIRYTLKNLI